MADEIRLHFAFNHYRKSIWISKKQWKKKLDKTEIRNILFLCDIKGGSVHTALSQLCVYSNVRVFSGTNMNLVLDLLLSYQEGLDDEQAEQITNKCEKG